MMLLTMFEKLMPDERNFKDILNEWRQQGQAQTSIANVWKYEQKII